MHKMHIWVPRPVIACEQRITLPADIFSGRIRATVYNERGGVVQSNTTNNMVLDNCFTYLAGERTAYFDTNCWYQVRVGTGTAEPLPTDTGLTVSEGSQQSNNRIKNANPAVTNEIWSGPPPYEFYTAWEIPASLGPGDFTEWCLIGSTNSAFFKGLFRDEFGNPVIIHKPTGSVLVVEHWFTINALPDVLVRSGTIQGGSGGTQTYNWTHYYNNDNMRHLYGPLYNYHGGKCGDSDAPSTSTTLAGNVIGNLLGGGSYSRTKITKTKFRYTLSANSTQLNGVAIRELIPATGYTSGRARYAGGRFTFSPGITKTDEYAMSIAVELELGLTR